LKQLEGGEFVKETLEKPQIGGSRDNRHLIPSEGATRVARSDASQHLRR
jgi:hypothetical protein